MRGRPVRVARVAVEDESAGLQSLFEFFTAESDGLLMIVRTDDFKIETFANRFPDDNVNPGFRAAMRPSRWTFSIALRSAPMDATLKESRR